MVVVTTPRRTHSSGVLLFLALALLLNEEIRAFQHATSKRTDQLLSASRWQSLRAARQLSSEPKGASEELGLAHLYVQVNKTCDAECTRYGNCNAELGTCECPFGYTGPKCTEPLLPACQLGPGKEPFWGFMVPRSCECAKQAWSFFGCTEGAETCRMHTFTYRDVRCYKFKNKPDAEQYSLMPLQDTPDVEYFKGNIQRGLNGLHAIPPEDGVKTEDLWGRKSLSLPLDRCPQSCNGHGACIQEGVNNPPRCECYKGYQGHDCSQPMDKLCYNGCSGRGKCLRGFCHCTPPYFGLGCSRQYAWQLAPGAVHVPNRVQLRIYMYDMPANVAFPVPLDDNIFDIDNAFYQTHIKFTEMLLKDDAVRTENPWEANMFFIPAHTYAYVSNTNPPANQVAAVVHYVRQNFPWYNMSRGRDHFIWTTGDRGSCYVPAELRNIIHITQFGLHTSLRDGRSTFLKPLPQHHDHGCFHPNKDILAAPLHDTANELREAPETYKRIRENHGADPQRDVLIFFAGTVRPNDKVYSGGARQAVWQYLKDLKEGPNKDNYTDVHFVEGRVANYADLHRRSKFCLAPHGAGFGIRLTIAMAHACIPVIVQDSVWQPYESDGLLPYAEFSVRLGKADVQHLVPILRSLPPERLNAMRLAMARHYGAFLWDPALGGTAYNHTVAALQRRLSGIWGHLWHTRRNSMSRR